VQNREKKGELKISGGKNWGHVAKPLKRGEKLLIRRTKKKNASVRIAEGRRPPGCGVGVGCRKKMTPTPGRVENGTHNVPFRISEKLGNLTFLLRV